MGWFILLLIVGAVVMIAVNANAKHNTAKAKTDAFLATHEGWDVYVSPFSNNVIAIDQNSRRLAIGEPEHAQEFPWEMIASVEVEKDGETLTQTNRGSQAVGAAAGAILLGPAGLLLGGLSGSKRASEKVKRLTLKIIVEDQGQPIHRVQFFDSPSPVKAESLRPVAENMEKFHALISNAIRNVERVRSTSQPALAHRDSSSELSNLWSLHREGALTEAEFAAAKARLFDETPKLSDN